MQLLLKEKCLFCQHFIKSIFIFDGCDQFIKQLNALKAVVEFIPRRKLLWPSMAKHLYWRDSKLVDHLMQNIHWFLKYPNTCIRSV